MASKWQWAIRVILAGIAVVGIALVMLLSLAAPALADPSLTTDVTKVTTAAGTSGGAGLLQFTSAGHVLGFSADGIIIASTSHMLKIDFLNSRAVAPEADGAVSGGSSSGAALALGRVTYQNLWDGVTLVYEASGGSVVKSTYYVDAAKVDSIRLGYNRAVQIDENGNLVIAYEDGTIVEASPLAWQETAGGRQPVTVSYILYREGEVGFSVGDYLPGIPVVIDPVMTWNTFLGGSDSIDYGLAIAVDGSGNVYVAGDSTATWQGSSSPVRAYTASTSDAFAAKLNSSGVLQWNTFLGGSGSDNGQAIAVDGSGNVYVAGTSDQTWGAPVRAFTSGIDGFAAKLNSSGVLQWNTFQGGSGDDKTFGIAVDGSGNVYVCGESTATWQGTSLPVRAFTSNGTNKDSFTAKLDSSGNLTWNTFQGSNGTDSGQAITLDGSSNVYVAGYSSTTWGTPVRAYTSGYDAFAAKLNSSGTLQWNTFLGGSGNDYGYSIALDGSGNVFVVGQSDATWGVPIRPFTANGTNTDALTAKLSSNGALTWNTFLGGGGNDFGYGVALDGSGNVYVAGYSSATWEAPMQSFTVNGTNTHALAAKLDSGGNLTWNTFLGGSGTDFGYGIALDGSGNVYVAGCSTATWSTPMRAYTSEVDAFAAKLDKALTAAITYSPAGQYYKSGTLVTITASFTNNMADSPVVQIALSGANALAPTNMTKSSAKVYTYVYKTGAVEGTSTVVLSTGTDVAGNVITSAPTSGATFTVDNTAPTNQNTVFAASVAKKGGATVTIVSSGDPINTVWFAPSGTTTFVVGSTMTNAGGTATSILAPATAGIYYCYVIDAAGNISSKSTAILTVDNTAPTNQNTVFATSLTKIGGATVAIVSSGDATNNVWFAPSGTTTFTAGPTMTKAASGTATTILAPANEGTYYLFVIDAAGNISAASTATLTVNNTALVPTPTLTPTSTLTPTTTPAPNRLSGWLIVVIAVVAVVVIAIIVWLVAFRRRSQRK